VGAVSFISKNASQADKELAARLALAYTRASKDGKFDVFVDGEKFNIAREDKELAQEFFVK
jgi:thiamine biosynthesis protein:exsB